MERLTNLVGTLSALRTTSNSILSKMLPIMEQIAEEDNDIVGEVAHSTELDDKEVAEFLEKVTLQIIADAEVVRKEIDAFATAAGEGRSEIAAKIASFPFLADVWYGDAYDGVEGIPALQKLLGELREEESKASDDWLIDHATKSLVVETE